MNCIALHPRHRDEANWLANKVEQHKDQHERDDHADADADQLVDGLRHVILAENPEDETENPVRGQ